MTIELEFDNMINIPFSVVIRKNKKKNVIMIIGVIFCNHCHWNRDFSHSFTQGKKKTKQILSAPQGIEIFRFKGKTVRRTG